MRHPFDQLLATRPDPLDVLKTTARVVEHARFVSIQPRAIAHAADALAARRIAPPAWNYDYHFFDGTDRSVNYLFLLDTLNFCFWGSPRWSIEYRGKRLDGYWALAACLKRAAEENPRTLDPEFWARIPPQELAGILRGRGEIPLWARIPPQELAGILRGRGEIPLLAERWRNVRELGAVLCNHWNGSAAKFVENARGDASRLAQMLAENFASFNDTTIYRIGRGQTRTNAENRLSLRGAGFATKQSPTAPRGLLRYARNDIFEVHFLKRAQILAADLFGAFGGKQWGAFQNMDALTAFADYKLPQLLRAWGILRYTPSLARRVDAQREIAAGSAEEIEIRAATLWAVEFLREELATRGKSFWSIQVDWILWEASQAKFAGMKPYHRVRTVYY